jgi:hypothetical protein
MALSARDLEIIKNFDQLSDDVVVSPAVASVILGPSPRTLRRSPPIPKVQVTEKLVGFRVGNIRQKSRGNNPQTAA